MNDKDCDEEDFSDSDDDPGDEHDSASHDERYIKRSHHKQEGGAGHALDLNDRASDCEQASDLDHASCATCGGPGCDDCDFEYNDRNNNKPPKKAKGSSLNQSSNARSRGDVGSHSVYVIPESLTNSSSSSLGRGPQLPSRTRSSPQSRGQSPHRGHVDMQQRPRRQGHAQQAQQHADSQSPRPQSQPSLARAARSVRAVLARLMRWGGALLWFSLCCSPIPFNLLWDRVPGAAALTAGVTVQQALPLLCAVAVARAVWRAVK